MKLYCPHCYQPVWDLPYGHKLAKCWNCGLAFDTLDMEPDDVRLTGRKPERIGSL